MILWAKGVVNMGQKQKSSTIVVQVTPETKEKAAWLARQSCRSLSGYVRHLLLVRIRDYEAENGPIDRDGGRPLRPPAKKGRRRKRR